MNPGFVYFDLDDTLLDHRSAERAALKDVTDYVWTEADGERVAEIQRRYHERNLELWHAYAAGEIGRAELRHLRFAHIVEYYDLPHSWSELDTFYMQRYGHYWREVVGAREAFETIARRLPVGVITNGFADTQREKLQRFPFIERRSRAVVISEEVGFLKPDPRLFLHAERAAGVVGGVILYVGDSFRSDVLGALNAGWKAAWFTPADSTEELPDDVFAFSAWDELVGALCGTPDVV